MIIDTNTTININFAATGEEEIIQNLSILYSTPKGSVPFDREFGIDWTIIDNPLPVAKSLLIAEYITATKKYEPRVEVVSVDFNSYEDGNILKPKVVVNLV